MLIVEHFFLIACDPRIGLPTWPRRTQGAAQLAAAALLLDLATQRRLQIRDSLVHADAAIPIPHPLLYSALQAVGAHPVTVSGALEVIARRLNPLVEKVLDGLFRRDLLHRYESRRWLLIKRVRYPLRSMQARNEAVLSLRHAVHVEDDLHGLALLMLADVSGLLPELLDAREHELATRRLLALNGTQKSTQDTLGILINVRAALLA
jgi:Golgi phosphoprotein 3 (GPP34)